MKTFERPSIIIVTPSRNGNTFLTDNNYLFRHHKRNIYMCVNEHGGESYHRYETYEVLTDGSQSAHLWDGEGLFEYTAGHWSVVDTD